MTTDQLLDAGRLTLQRHLQVQSLIINSALTVSGNSTNFSTIDRASVSNVWLLLFDYCDGVSMKDIVRRAKMSRSLDRYITDHIYSF